MVGMMVRFQWWHGRFYLGLWWDGWCGVGGGVVGDRVFWVR